MNSYELNHFIGSSQRLILSCALRRTEGAYFRRVIDDLSHRIAQMPRVGANAPICDPNSETVHLHYFMGSRHWYVLARDASHAQERAYGVCRWGSEEPEAAGYFPLNVLLSAGAELDMYFEPTPLAELKRAWARE